MYSEKFTRCRKHTVSRINQKNLYISLSTYGCSSQMAAAVVKKNEIDAVSKQRNWEQLLTTEREIAKAWCQSWGSLYEGALTQQQQIEMLEGKLNRMPGDQGTQSNYQLSFKGEPPFHEYPVGPLQKKVLRIEDVEKLATEMMVAQDKTQV